MELLCDNVRLGSKCMEVTNTDRRKLISHGINYDHKKFYSTDPRALFLL